MTRIAAFGGVYSNPDALAAPADESRARCESLWRRGDLGGLGGECATMLPLLRDHGVTTIAATPPLQPWRFSVEMPEPVAAIASNTELKRRLRRLGPRATVVVTSGERPFTGHGVTYRRRARPLMSEWTPVARAWIHETTRFTRCVP